MIILDCPQKSPEWLAARRGIPTGSEFGRIITPARAGKSDARWSYMADLLVELEDSEPEDDGFSSQWMDRGTELEPIARSVYSFTHDVDVKEVGFVMLDDRSVGASPDGLTDEGGVEIKCPKLRTHLTTFAKQQTPNEYLPQIHGNILICEREWWDFMSYHPGEPPYYERHYRSDYTDKLAKELKQFCEDFAEVKARRGK